MSRVITFSRTFPGYHPRAGEPTHFVSKIWQSLYNQDIDFGEYTGNEALEKELSLFVAPVDFDPKHTTIRAGHRWKVGDWFRPVVWGNDINPSSDRKGPYQSKQIQFAPEIQVKRIWDFEMDKLGVCSIADPGEQLEYTFLRRLDDDLLDKEISKNDGLTDEDFYFWFSRSPEFKKKGRFDGQIICWNESINY